MSAFIIAIRLFFLAILVAGCADKAEPDFQRCQQLETRKEFEEARSACLVAVSKDPQSRSGKLAQARLAVLATEAQDAFRQQQARFATLANQQREGEEHVKKLKSQYEDATAREASLKAQLEHASNPDEKKRLEAALGQALAAKDAALKSIGSGKPGSKCPPGDPMCGDL
jgi:hypothetical protein